MNESLHISEAGLSIEKQFEKGPPNISPQGFATRIYICPAGRPTIGWGHVIVSSGDYMRHATIDAVTADKLLAQDNAVHEHCIQRHVQVELTQNEFDALCCLLHNIGETNFIGSTMLRKLNAGDKPGAAAEFPHWDKFHNPKTGKLAEEPGLRSRRLLEQALFQGVKNV